MIDRYATRDVELAGAPIGSGDFVDDLARRREPRSGRRSRIRTASTSRRENARHQVAFAHGPHVCIGMHLARLEAHDRRRARLFERLPGLRLDPERPTAPRGLVFRKPPTLDVLWRDRRARPRRSRLPRPRALARVLRAVFGPLGLQEPALFDGERGEKIHYLRFPVAGSGSLGLRQALEEQAFELYAPGFHHLALRRSRRGPTWTPHTAAARPRGDRPARAARLAAVPPGVLRDVLPRSRRFRIEVATARDARSSGFDAGPVCRHNADGTVVPPCEMAETTGTQAIDRAAQLLVRVVESAQPPSVGELADARRPAEEHDLAARRRRSSARVSCSASATAAG